MPTIRSAVIAAAVTALAGAGCGAGSGSHAAPPATAAKPSASSTLPTSAADRGVHVDLTITGDVNARIKGTKGACESIGTSGHAYNFSGSDYPGLGPNGAFSLSIGGRIGDRTEPPFLKMVVGTSGFLSGADVSGVHVNPEGTSVNLDQSVSGSTGGGPMQTAQVTGTISCS